MEVRCRPLDRAALLAEVDFLAAFLVERGLDSIRWMYGTFCNVDVDEYWIDRPGRASDLRGLVAREEAAGTLRLGEGDLIATTESGGVEVVLCHESDVHFTGPDELALLVEARWRNMGFEPYRVEPAGRS
jgi:hypothetical protein